MKVLRAEQGGERATWLPEELADVPAVSPRNVTLYDATYLEDDLRADVLAEVPAEWALIARGRRDGPLHGVLMELVSRECARRLALMAGAEPDLRTGP